jgi:photosystem II stability/assembly factor-like uncharacterized protein
LMGNGILPIGTLPIGIIRIVPELAIVGLQGTWASWSSWFSSEWRSVGPSIWLGSPPASYQSGAMSQVSIDPNNSSCIYASGFDGGLWRLDDVSDYPNRLWTPLTDGNPTLRTSAFAIAPNNSRKLYLGDGNGHILRSEDRGNSWNLTSNSQFRYVTKILVHPSNDQVIYVASDLSRLWDHGGVSGFYKSDNGGSTWKQLNPLEVTDAVMDPGSPSIVYVGVRTEGLYKVTNDGGTWDLVYPVFNVTFPTGAPIQLSTIKIALGQQGSDSNRLVAVKFHKQLFINRSGGSGTWESKGDRGQPSGRQFQDQSEYCNVVAVDPFDNNIILTGLQDLYRTADGGAGGNSSWQQVAGYNTTDDVHGDQINIIFDPSQRGVAYLANDGGIYRSTNSGQGWSELNRGLITSQIPEGIAMSYATAIASAYHGGLIATENIFSPIPEWRSIPGGEQEFNNRISWEWTKTYADPKRANVFYLFGTQLVRRIVGPGISTTNIVPIGNFRPEAIAVDSRPDHDIILSSTIDRNPASPTVLNPKIKRTRNGNSNTPNWNDEVVEDILPNENIISITFAPSDQRVAYATSNLGSIYRKLDVDSNNIWKHVGQWSEQSVKQIVVNPEHFDRIYLISNNRIVRSENAGRSFIPIHGSVPNSLPPSTELISLVAYPFNPQVLFVASSVGIFITPNEGRTWLRFDAGLPNARLSQIIWHLSSLYASTVGRGLWRKRISHRSTAVKPDDTLYHLVKMGEKHPDPVIKKVSDVNMDVNL